MAEQSKKPKKTPKNKNTEKVLTTGEVTGIEVFRRWFATQGYDPFPFQEEAWQAYREGKGGLIQVPTGAGKTYAAFGGPLSALIENQQDGLQILMVTPLRALSRDMEKALKAPISDLGLPIIVESRTGDTSSTIRSRQKKRMPHVLITTPESLSLLLSYEDATERFATLQGVIVDEWHELMASKRGIQMELALARLRRFSPNLRTWALSATVANLEEAAQCAVGAKHSFSIVTAKIPRPLTIDSLIPEHIETLPWAGHLGAEMLPALLAEIDIDVSTLVFTNVRSHAERWYQNILDARPEWAGLIALHHGSLSLRERQFVEEGLKDGFIKLVICTSSLDLGVDFAPVERVFQIGSPKGIARMIQRAGRAAHRPGAPCRITCVPTQALELAEIASVRHAIAEGRIEARLELKKPYDVLVQHLVTCALGGGFNKNAMYQEIKTTVSYEHLTREEFDWILQLVRDGGKTLAAYPEYHKIELHEGKYIVPDKRVAQLHRFNIGTITSDASMNVAFLKGKALGQVEESFISRMSKGDVFTFAGRTVEFIMVKDMTVYVRLSKKKSNVVPRWSGGRLPLSASLADELRHTLERNIKIREPEPELVALEPVLAAQQALSLIPKSNELLAERLQTNQGHYLFLYPFEGRLVHEGLAALLSYRMSHTRKLTFQLTVNDYGIQFLSEEPFPFEECLVPSLFSTEHLVTDLMQALNLSELARRQFRDIARIAGLVYQNYPGTHKSSRQLNTSSSVIYDVFQRFDSDNLLLGQARKEVLERQFEQGRLADALRRLERATIQIVHLEKPSPLAFPLMAEQVMGQLSVSNETLAERIQRIQKQWLK